MSAPIISYTTTDLSADCSQVQTDVSTEETSISSADLLERLRAFGNIPAVDLIDSRPSIQLKIEGRGSFVINNEAGQLFMVESPASENSPVMRTPEEIVQFLDDEFTPADVEEVEEVVVETSKARSILNSPILLVVLVAVFGASLYFSLQPEPPEGVTMITDSSRVAGFEAEFAGRYGYNEPGDTIYVVEDGRFKVFEVTEDGYDPDALLDEEISFGQRGGEVVMVVSNGAVLSRDQVGALVFEDEIYPRLP
ncbi:MAG: hypothetical protein SynsKO_08170 [Synoicihabitans sp.]